MLREQLPGARATPWPTSDERDARVAESTRASSRRCESTVDEEATALSRREAEFAERRRLIEQRRGEIEPRLEGRSSERAEAAGRRESLEFDLQVLERLVATRRAMPPTRSASPKRRWTRRTANSSRRRAPVPNASKRCVARARSAETRLAELGERRAPRARSNRPNWSSRSRTCTR